MSFLKSLFGRKKEQEPEKPLEAVQAPQPAAEPAPAPEPQAEPAPAEEVPAPKKAVTADMLADSMEACKAALIKCGLSAEDMEKYSSALTTMQQAVRGLHPAVDVTDLMDFLNRLFCSGLLLILSCGTPLDHEEAMEKINESIEAIPSTEESDVKIATLELAILIQKARSLSCEKTIAGLKIKKEGYEEAARKLVLDSKAETPEDLSEKEKAYFDQYQQRIKQLDGQIRGADRLLIEFNQKIVALNSTIDTIRLFPSASNLADSQIELDDLLKKMPGIAEFAIMVEEATYSAEKYRAQMKAEIKEMETKLEEGTFIEDERTHQELRKVFEETKGLLAETDPVTRAEKDEPLEEKPQTLTE